MRTVLFAIATMASMTQAVSIQQDLKESCQGFLQPVTGHAELVRDDVLAAIAATNNPDRKNDLEGLISQSDWIIAGTIGSLEEANANGLNDTREKCRFQAVSYIRMIDEISDKIPRAGQPHAAGGNNPFFTVPIDSFVCASKCGIGCVCDDEEEED